MQRMIEQLIDNNYVKNSMEKLNERYLFPGMIRREVERKKGTSDFIWSQLLKFK